MVKEKVNNPSKSPTGLILLRFDVFNKPDYQPSHSMFHYTWKALKKENCTPPPTQYMGTQNVTENTKFGPVVYPVQILKEFLTQTGCSLPLVVKDAPTNQWKIS